MKFGTTAHFFDLRAHAIVNGSDRITFCDHFDHHISCHGKKLEIVACRLVLKRGQKLVGGAHP